MADLLVFPAPKSACLESLLEHARQISSGMKSIPVVSCACCWSLSPVRFLLEMQVRSQEASVGSTRPQAELAFFVPFCFVERRCCKAGAETSAGRLPWGPPEQNRFCSLSGPGCWALPVKPEEPLRDPGTLQESGLKHLWGSLTCTPVFQMEKARLKQSGLRHVHLAAAGASRLSLLDFKVALCSSFPLDCAEVAYSGMFQGFFRRCWLTRTWQQDTQPRLWSHRDLSSNPVFVLTGYL